MAINPKALEKMRKMQGKDHGRTGTSLAVGAPQAGPVSTIEAEEAHGPEAPAAGELEAPASTAQGGALPAPEATSTPEPAQTPKPDPKPAQGGNGAGKPPLKPAIRAFVVSASAPKDDRIVFSVAKDIAKFVERLAARRGTTMTAVWMEAISFPLPEGWWEKQFVIPGIKPQAAFRQYHKEGGKRYQSSVVCVPEFKEGLEAERASLEALYSEFAPKLGQLVESHITVWAQVQAGVDPMAQAQA